MSYIMIIYVLHFWVCLCVSCLYETYRIITSVWLKRVLKVNVNTYQNITKEASQKLPEHGENIWAA